MWSEGIYTVLSVGDEIDHVHIGEVPAVSEARVFERQVQSGIAGAERSCAVEVGEVYFPQVFIFLECIFLHGVELIVVVRTDVVAKLQGALVFIKAIAVRTFGGPRHDQMLNLVALHLMHLLHRTILIGVGILGSILVEVGLGHSVVVDEVFLQRLPRLVVEEVLFTRFVNADMECYKSVALADSGQ